MTAPPVAPSACRHCSCEQRSHGKRWTAGIGWHTHTPPTDQQIKDRMLARRAYAAGQARWSVAETLGHLRAALARAELAEAVWAKLVEVLLRVRLLPMDWAVDPPQGNAPEAYAEALEAALGQFELEVLALTTPDMAEWVQASLAELERQQAAGRDGSVAS